MDTGLQLRAHADTTYTLAYTLFENKTNSHARTLTHAHEYTHAHTHRNRRE